MKRRFLRGIREWDYEPDDWRFFLRLALVGFGAITLLLLALAAIWNAVTDRDASFVFVLWYATASTATFWWAGWWTAFVTRRAMDAERRRYGMPYRPVPDELAVVITMVAVVVMVTCSTLARSGASGNALAGALGSTAGLMTAFFFISWRFRGEVFKAPHNVARLDAEWAHMHGAPSTVPRPHERPNGGTPE